MSDRHGRGGGRGYRQDRSERPHHHRGGGRGDYQPRHHHGQGGGGGGRGGGRHPPGRQHAGFKRGRDDQPVEDPYKQLVARLMAIGSLKAQREPELDIEEVARLLRRELSQGKTEETISLLLLCITQLTTKTPHFAALIALLEQEQPDFVALLLAKGRAELEEALATGQRTRARLLLRLFGCLAVSGVVQEGSVMEALQGLVDAALQMASAGTDPSGHTWQPYADHLVYLALMTLPWCAEHVSKSGAAADALEQLLAAVEQYMGQRPLRENIELRPFYAGKSSDDRAAESDSGAASFLGSLYGAIKDCQMVAQWEVQSVPQLNMRLHRRSDDDEQQERYQLQPLAVPQQPPGVEPGLAHSVAATRVLQAYPPRGGMRLLVSKDPSADPPALDRIVAEEYMLDSLELEEGDRVNCARIFSAALPLRFAYDSLLAETLFSQMLRLPQPALQPAAYGTIMVELCKMMPNFARAMSACVRECFSRMAFMDPELRARLAEWLPYHLSNFHFAWPWDKWRRVLEAPHYDAQRHFCGHVISRLVRLAFYHRIKDTLPEGFHALLGPPPGVCDMPVDVRKAMFPQPPQLPPQALQPPQPPPLALTAAGEPGKQQGDEEMPEQQEGAQQQEKEKEAGAAAPAAAAGSEQAAAGDDVEMQEPGPPPPAAPAAEPPAEQPPSREDQLVTELVARMRKKASYEELRPFLQQSFDPEAVQQQQQQQEEERLSEGELQLLQMRVVARSVLLTGCKSWEHSSRVMERYAYLIRDSAAPLGAAGAAAFLDCAAAIWQAKPQRLVMVVARAISLQLLPAPHVVQWLFAWPGWSSLEDPKQTALALEMLFDVVAKTQALVSEAQAGGGVLAREMERCQREIDNLVAHQQEKAQAGKQEQLPHYLDKMKEKEAAARARLVQLQQEQEEQPQRMEAAHARLDELLLAIYRCFATWLLQQPAAAAKPAAADREETMQEGSYGGGEDEMDTAEGSAEEAEALYLQGLRFGTFRAFSRHFFAESASVAQHIEEIFGAEEMPAAVKEIVATTLRLQIAAE